MSNIMLSEKFFDVDFNLFRKKKKVSLEQGFTSLDKKCPDLRSEWMSELNVFLFGLTSDAVSYVSDSKVWWKCSIPECSWMWKTKIRNRVVSGTQCPSCVGKVVNKGFNDLETRKPSLMSEWMFARNALFNIFPWKLTCGSSVKAWWKCSIPECSWEWKTAVACRTTAKRTSGCPSCSNRVVNRGFNDLASKRPDLLDEWLFEKNDCLNVYPDSIVYGFKKFRVWWKCRTCSHKWKTFVYARTRLKNPTGCPECSKRKNGSTVEKEFYDYVLRQVKKLNAKNSSDDRDLSVVSRDIGTVVSLKTGRFIELDVYVPELKLAFEFDGEYYHSDRFAKNKGFNTVEEMHLNKDRSALKSGISVVHIKESDWKNSRQKVEQLVLQKILFYIDEFL